MAVIKNDVAALDRVLSTLGYTGDLNKEMPRQKHERIYGQGELTRAILDVLRDAIEPMATRDIAREILALNEQDARDRRLLTEVTRRVSKALRIQKTERHSARRGRQEAADGVGGALPHRLACLRCFGSARQKAGQILQCQAVTALKVLHRAMRHPLFPEVLPP